MKRQDFGISDKCYEDMPRVAVCVAVCVAGHVAVCIVVLIFHKSQKCDI